MKSLLQSIASLFNLVVISKEEHDVLKKPIATTTTGEPRTPANLLDYSKLVAMLQEYDTTKLIVNKGEDATGMKTLDYEDARTSTFGFDEMENYLAYSKKIASEKGITLEGISFIKGTYGKDTAPDAILVGYESLIYLPTALINGKETLIDLKNSTKDNLISFKEVLADNGYDWRYDKTDYSEKKQVINVNDNNMVASFKSSSSISSASNKTKLAPPYNQ